MTIEGRPTRTRPLQAGRRVPVRLAAAGTLPASLLVAAALGAAGIAALPSPAVAQETGDALTGEAPAAEPLRKEAPPLVGDRPDFTESASAVTRLQVESGYTFTGSGSVDAHELGEVLLRIPVVRGLELRAGLSSYAWEDASPPAAPSDPESSGFTDASLGVKLELAEPAAGEGGPAIALLVGTTLPTGDVSEAGMQPGAKLAGALDLSDRFSLGSNVGVEAREEADVRFAELSGSLALGVGLTEAVGAYLEAYGFVPTGDGPDASTVVNGGLTWLVGPDFQLDARIGAGLSGSSPDLLAGAGVVWRP